MKRAILRALLNSLSAQPWSQLMDATQFRASQFN